MLVVTTNDIPGWEIQRVCGEVFGLTVRSRNAFSQMGAGLKSMFGGELGGMTKNLSQSRNEVMSRMLEHARAKGGNAVIGMRFDTSEMGETWTELCAYGTAVVAVPVSDGAKQTADELGYGNPEGSPPSRSSAPNPPPRVHRASAGLPKAAVVRSGRRRPVADWTKPVVELVESTEPAKGRACPRPRPSRSPDT